MKIDLKSTPNSQLEELAVFLNTKVDDKFIEYINNRFPVFDSYLLSKRDGFNKKVKVLPSLFSILPITYFSLTNNVSLENIDSLVKNDHVKSIHINNCHINSLPLGFPKMKNLTRLQISVCDIKCIPEDFNDFGENLESLHLYGNPVEKFPEKVGLFKHIGKGIYIKK